MSAPPRGAGWGRVCVCADMGASAPRVSVARRRGHISKVRIVRASTHPVIHPLDPEPDPLGDGGASTTMAVAGALGRGAGGTRDAGGAGGRHGARMVAITPMTMKMAKNVAKTSSSLRWPFWGFGSRTGMWVSLAPRPPGICFGGRGGFRAAVWPGRVVWVGGGRG
ncbi:hypothetical protein GCM10010280_00200 [Streptomyces pilosus]|uniref:Uncharacterized protein n=1 Tax=Streptomyces pilosus TaxID=28893 RepID=A0A918BC69_9ACTN|nr:hypothetical protein GCM10010280_00200 [Streptomyces pilosus]